MTYGCSGGSGRRTLRKGYAFPATALPGRLCLPFEAQLRVIGISDGKGTALPHGAVSESLTFLRGHFSGRRVSRFLTSGLEGVKRFG